jgi:hypothetical protein
MKNRHLTALVASLAVFTLARPVFAADGGSRAPGILGEAERWVAAAMAGPTAASDPSTRGGASASASETEAATTAERAPAAQEEDKPSFMDLLPNAALVARDWRGSTKLAGQRTMLVDELRPTASSRMLVARVATGGRFTTFGQLGVGEWRIDTAMFPNARAYSEIAGQVGAGFELALASRLRMAGEVQYTLLSRNATYSPDEVAPRMLAVVLALDARF